MEKRYVMLSLPKHSTATIDQVEEFCKNHLPDSSKFSVKYTETECNIMVEKKHAAAMNILYYSIPDYLKCAY